jgi:hypothetical protein
MDLSFTPRLDAKTLQVPPLTAPPGGDTKVRWVPSERPVGTVLHVAVFGVGSLPAELEVSQGPKPPQEVASWLELPSPPLTDPDAAAGGREHLLAAWHRRVFELLWTPARAGDAARTAQQEFRTWIENQGAEWFDRFVHQALDSGAGATAARWLEALRAAGWCEVYPVPAGAGRCVWPKGKSSREAPHVRWVYDDDMPAGHALEPVQFAPSLPRLKGAFSLGRKRSPSSLGLAEQLVAAVGSAPRLKEALGALAEQLLSVSRDVLLGVDATVAATELVEPFLAPLLQLRAGDDEASAPAEWLPTLDRVLTPLRDWAARNGVKILPGGFSFSAPVVNVEEGDRVQVEFSDRVDWGGMSLSSFGLATLPEARIVRSPKAVHSAGREPKNWTRLRAELPKSGHPRAEELLRDLQKWPARKLENRESLGFAAQQLFEEFWDGVGDNLSEPLKVSAELISTMLRDEFQLETFEPRSVRDLPQDWFKVVGRGPKDTGRVKRTIRPGLKNQDNMLCIFPAYVELE